MQNAPYSGLASHQALERLTRDGPNILPQNVPESPLKLFIRVISEPMFLMLLVAGGIYFALGDRGEALFLLAFVVLVIGITLAQEQKHSTPYKHYAICLPRMHTSFVMDTSIVSRVAT